MRFAIQYFDRKTAWIVRMINLLHAPPVLGGLVLSFAISNCPAAPGRANLSSIALAAEEALPRAETGTYQSNLFGFSLLVKLMAAQSEENIVISPFSLELALGMVYAGCSGASAEELSRVVGSTPQIESQKALFPGMALRSDLPPARQTIFKPSNFRTQGVN